MQYWTDSTTGEKTRMPRAENTEAVRAVFRAWHDAEYRDQLVRLQPHGLGLPLIEAMLEDAIVATRKHDAYIVQDTPRREELDKLAEQFIAACRDVHARHGYDGPMAEERVARAIRSAVKAGEEVRPEPLAAGD